MRTFARKTHGDGVTPGRREFLKMAAAVAAAFSLEGRSLLAIETPGQTRNLIFIIADQHSGMALGCAGHPVVRTPRLDGLAREGVVFTHAYTCGTTCAPSRASIHTGLHVQTHGVRSNSIPLREDCRSIWNLMDEHEYSLSDVPRTGLYRRDQYLDWLTQLGYQNVISPIIGSADTAKIIPTPYRYEVGRAGLSVDHSQDAWTIRNAIQFLEENKDRRFCLWVRLFGAHDPWVVPAPYDAMYRPSDLPLPPYLEGEFDSKPPRQKRNWESTGADQLSDDQIRTILAHYLGMVSYTDMLVGRLMDRISALGLDESSVTVYTGDHGDNMGHHRNFTKGYALYEPAMRIPLIVRAPGGLPRGAKVDALVSGVDFLPTILELMGLPAEPGLHGTSLVPLWRGNRQKAHDRVFACQGYEGLDRIVMMRTEDWKLTRYDDGGGELYDLREDPHELRNLIDEPHYSSTVRRLTQEMEEWDDRHPHVEPQITGAMEQANPERVEQIREAFRRWKEKRRARNAVLI
jgi:arylsulfatase A-like enzyme